MIQQSLFQAEASADRPGWVPQQPPSLAGVRDLSMDTEATGLRWFSGDRAVGVSACLPDGSTYYLPHGHAGGNIPEERVADWFRQEVRHKHIRFFNGPYDLNIIRVTYGVDLEAQGCTFSDAGHWAALLNDNRYTSNLESISREYLGYGKKPGPDLTNGAQHYHAADLEEYARWDSRLVHDLWEKCRPMLESEDLMRVAQLEDACLPATAEMMWNGAPLDEELLDQWLVQSEKDFIQCLLDLRAALGCSVNPGSVKDMRLIFDKCGLPYPKKNEPGTSDHGKVTFSKDYLEGIEHPTIRIVRRARRLTSYRNKYLIPYKNDLKRNGVLRYALHQMRTGDDDGDSGTISGRYSSSGYITGDGVNIQQVAGKKFSHSVKEEKDWPYKTRKLFIARSGKFGSGDAEQIEYRWFAHYAQPPAVMAAYAENPRTNYHRITQKMLADYKEVTYELTKDLNFACLFGAAPPKVAVMLKMTEKEVLPFYRAYHQAVPEVNELMQKCIRVARQRGYVKTFLGRRARFPEKEFLYSALNRVIQGSAADEMKTKLVALRKAKTGMTLRFCVHDEVCGDVPDQEAVEKVNAVLNTQLLETRVPLLWSFNAGPNWEEAKK